MKRLIPVFLALLAGCSTSPQRQEANAECARGLRSTPNCGGLCAAIMLIELPFVGICDGARFVVDTFNDNRVPLVRDGMYSPRDGQFSVKIPTPGAAVAPYKMEQVISSDAESVFFIPSNPAEPAFSAGVRSNTLPESVTSLQEYVSSDFALVDFNGMPSSPWTNIRQVRRPFPVLVDGRQALLEVYVDLDDHSKTKAYYLIYVSKDVKKAELLSVAWAGPCPACGSGSEAEMLAGIPGASEFVSSFHLVQSPAEAAR